MTDNVNIGDFSGSSTAMDAKNVSSVFTPYVTEHGILSTASITRQANTTAYAAGNAVSNSASSPSALTFSSCGRFNGATVRLLSAILSSTQAPPGTPPNFDLLLFNASPTATNDLAALATSTSDLQKVVGVVPFIGAFPYYTSSTLGQIWRYEGNQLITLGGATTSLFGLVRINSAYTPKSAEVLTFNLNFGQE